METTTVVRSFTASSMSRWSILLLHFVRLPQISWAACPDVGGTMALTGACSYVNLKAQGCDSITIDISAKEIQQICEISGITFGSITNVDYQFDKAHMDGGGHWNIGQDGIADGVDLLTDAARIGRFATNVAPYARINWPIYESLNNYTNPVYGNSNQRQRQRQRRQQEQEQEQEQEQQQQQQQRRRRRLQQRQRELDATTLSTVDRDANYNAYMSNFNLSDSSCQLNTVMCCFISNRLSTFTGNSNVCSINMDKAKHSNRVFRGYGTYDSNTPAYCVGFIFGSSVSDPNNRFKGNALFDVAYNTVFRTGNVENIPGAPMCGCLEQMPVVTRADCRKVNVLREAYVVSRPSATELVISTDMTKTSLSYSSCSSDLKTMAQMQFRSNRAKRAMVANQLVGAGQCKTMNARILNEQFWVSSGGDLSAYTTTVDPNQWIQFAGLGNYFFPVRDSLDVQDANLRSLMGSNPPFPLIYRICSSCRPKHQHIYYKRLTPIPSNLNFVNLLLNNFTTINITSNPNVLGKDFQLYSTLADANAGTNSWQYCNSDNVENTGFPGSCGPTDYADCQWNRYNDYMCDWDDYNGWLHGFFVQTK